jgi:hypothetical protein
MITAVSVQRQGMICEESPSLCVRGHGSNLRPPLDELPNLRPFPQAIHAENILIPTFFSFEL